MVNINESFPSKYLKASDLQGRDIKVAISHIEMEQVGNDSKPILYFVGKQKGLVLNKTNASMISMIYGPETDGWQGGELVLFPTTVDFKGQQTTAIRVKLPTRQVAPRQAPVAAPVQPAIPRQGAVTVMRTTGNGNGNGGEYAMERLDGSPITDPNDEIPF